VTALLQAFEGSATTLVVAADARLERAGAPTELDGADAAIAFLVGAPGNREAIAIPAATASATVEMMDRWQLPSERFGAQTDERATESAYLAALDTLIDEVFGSADRSVDALVVATEHARVRASVARNSRIRAGRVVSAVPALGCAGAADAGLLLAHALESARAGERVLLLSLADGADALLLDVVSDGSANAAPTVASQVAEARDVSYPTYLGWRGLIERDTGRRPPLAAPAPMPALRNVRWKYGLVGSRCRKCEAVHLPPERVCRSCKSVDVMDDHPIADELGTVRQITTDWLAWSPQPPLIQAIVAFDGGGQLRCEIADAFDGEVSQGDRVSMSFRLLRTVDGIHNYFWKAVPVTSSQGHDT
jgi:uncharacterized OB-fold protein